MTRFSLDWLRARDWQVLILPEDLPEDADEALADALRRHGHAALIGSPVTPDPAEPAAVFRFPTAADDMVAFRVCLGPSCHTVTFPADRSAALHFDDNAVLAGPADFLREAVPQREVLRARLADEVGCLSRMHQIDWMGPLLRHYEPVTLCD